LKLGITMLNHNKDDIEFVTEFPCFLGHPVYYYYYYDLFVEHMNYKIGFDIILEIRYLYYLTYT